MGPNGTGSSDVIETWVFYFQDMRDRFVEIAFDVTDYNYPIIVRMDGKQYTITDITKHHTRIFLKRQLYKGDRIRGKFDYDKTTQRQIRNDYNTDGYMQRALGRGMENHKEPACDDRKKYSYY